MKNKKFLKGIKLPQSLDHQRDPMNEEEYNEIIEKQGKWKTLTATIGYHIWYGIYNQFEESKDYEDMEWLLLCGLYIFHHWDESPALKKYSIPDMKKEMDPTVIYFKDRLIATLPEIKVQMDKMRALIKSNPEFSAPDFPSEPSKIFISVFIDELLSRYERTLSSTNPEEVFLFGLQALLLFVLDIKIKDPKFYDLIEDIGPYETEDAVEVMGVIGEVV